MVKELLYEIKFNQEEIFLMERAIDIASGMSAVSIDGADRRIKTGLSREKELGKKKFQDFLDKGIRDWDEAMTYFHVQRGISEKLKRLRWSNKELIERSGDGGKT